MRDYNQIPFRSPTKKEVEKIIPREQQQQQQPPLSSAVLSGNIAAKNTEKVNSVSTISTAPETPHSHHFLPQLQNQNTKSQRVNNNNTNNINVNNNKSMATTGTPRQSLPTTPSQPAAAAVAAPTTTIQSQPQMSTNDALQLRRDGAEKVIAKLRQQLDVATAEATSSRAAMNKSDAIIFELRSTVRQLKRQMESTIQQQQPQSGGGSGTAVPGKTDDSVTTTARDMEIGEMQIQLDKAHAQLLTADMVRKELEDTLEAEQYTWELRVQDQERTIVELEETISMMKREIQEDRSTNIRNDEESGNTGQRQLSLQQELEQALQKVEHWKSLCQTKHNQDNTELHERILALEQERTELQGCLDEALKELEAVDAELQNDNSALLREDNERLQEELRKAVNSTSIEPLQHLYRWILERDGVDAITVHKQSATDLVEAIQTHLEQYSNNHASTTADSVKELETQLSILRGDLKAREDSTTELRVNLKEALSLLRPLQDTVAKAEKEKARLLEQLERAKQSNETSMSEIKRFKELLNEKDDEIEALKQQIEALQLQLSKVKLETANDVVSQHNRSIGSPDDGDIVVSPRGKELRAKREQALKQILSDTQLRFNSLNRDASTGGEEMEKLRKIIDVHEQRIHELENELTVRAGELATREVELRNLHNELDESRSKIANFEMNGADNSQELEEIERRMRELEEEVALKNKDLSTKKEAQSALNKSLKDALGLIKPLQTHLAEAEMEKRELEEELQIMRRRVGDTAAIEMNGEKSIPTNYREDSKIIQHLEYTIQELELENSKLQDALEDMSMTLNASHMSASSPQAKSSTGKNDVKLREELVELKSRYEVTQGRLDDSFVENHTLVEALQKREHEENAMIQELKILQEQLATSQAELDSAKYIATSALVKIEQLNMQHVNGGGQKQLSDSQLDELYREKEKLIENELIKLI